VKAAAFIIAVACFASPASAFGACNHDAMQDAALDHLMPEFGLPPNDLEAWLGDWDAASLKAYRAKIDRLRERAAKVKDPCARAAYLHWADYYSRETAEAERELRDHHVRRSQDAFEAEQRRKDAAARSQHIERLP
jgi:hypothetical protein